MKKIIYIFLLVLFIFGYSTTKAAEEKSVLKVGLSNQNFSSQVFKSASFISEGNIKIIDMINSMPLDEIKKGSILKISFEDGNISILENNETKYQNLKGPLILNSNSNIGIMELNRKGTPAKYQGMIEIRIAKNNLGFHIINVVDLENYLRGVVPNEMPVTFGLEALKAQSVAARNYATNASISPNYHVTDSTASQVYYGANSYSEISDRAVEETKGIYALYQNNPITALYFSTSTGITDDWDDVFGEINSYGKHPYLKARIDNEKQGFIKNEEDFIKFLSKNDSGLDTNSPKFRWEVDFTKEELEGILHDTLQAQSKANLVNPKYDSDVKLEGLREIKPITRTKSGKVTELEIVSDSGTYRVKKELGIRRSLKKNNAILPSANFYIETIYPENLEKKKILGLFDVDESYPESFKFIGGGFGHGVGMSQFGAYNLAKAGKKYPEILRHYYSDIDISTMPKTVYQNDYNYWYNTEFYFDNSIYQKANLYIFNFRGVQDFMFKINELEFNDTRAFSRNKIIKIDITQYLKKGLNSVNFAPLYPQNKGKTLIYQVEFLEN